MKSGLTSVEVCAGAGGQALGLEQAGFSHQALVEIDAHCRQTLSMNRPAWNVVDGPSADLASFDGSAYRGIDLLAGGLPCPPFSVAGKQLGAADERNLFPDALRVIDESAPKAVLIENVKGFLDPAFASYREFLKQRLLRMGYTADWRLMNSAEFGVPQLRPRVIIVAIQGNWSDKFSWPETGKAPAKTVGDCLHDLMAARGWSGADAWRIKACEIAPTIVGGSKKHGGPDLGPTRARRAWAALGVDGLGIAAEAPEPEFTGMPRLTVRMVARLQGFPDEWQFSGRKTPAYRQVGNAFPPPFARAVGEEIATALSARSSVRGAA